MSPPKQFFFFIMEETKARVRTKELALVFFYSRVRLFFFFF